MGWGDRDRERDRVSELGCYRVRERDNYRVVLCSKACRAIEKA